MTDWRALGTQTQSRTKQISGNKGGLFTSFIESSSGEKQTAKLIYAGGERSIPIPMPFDSNTSWIRSIPQEATTAICGYRADTEDLVFLTYENSSPDNKLQAYAAGNNLYRPLQPGEHEIHSAGLAQSYYSYRPTLESRGGAIRSWLDQDKLESGAKAPLHTRQLWEHKSNEIGDEERFGVVRRPLNFLLKNPASAALALSPYSSIFFDYPFPDFTTPGGVPGFTTIPQAAVANASETTGELVGEFKQRVFAKEYLKVITNPLFGKIAGTLNTKLVDFREGQVFDDDGLQTVGPQGAYLRAQYKYFTPAGNLAPYCTTFSIDEIGNVDYTLSLLAKSGWTVTVPSGGINMQATTGIGFVSGLTFSVISTETSSIQAGDLEFQSAIGTSFETITGDWTNTVALGSYSTTVPSGNISYDTGLNFEVSCTNFNVTSITRSFLDSPIVDIGSSPTEAAMLGTSFALWLSDLLTAFITAAPALATGNLGAPTPMNPTLLSKLSELAGQVPSLISTSVRVSP